MDRELFEEELDNVTAGSIQSEKDALNNPELYRQKQIEELKKSKAALDGKDPSELTEEELDGILAGLPSDAVVQKEETNSFGR